MKNDPWKLWKIQPDISEYRAGFIVGLFTGVTGGVTLLGTVLFLFKYWL